MVPPLPLFPLQKPTSSPAARSVKHLLWNLSTLPFTVMSVVVLFNLPPLTNPYAPIHNHLGFFAGVFLLQFMARAR